MLSSFFISLLTTLFLRCLAVLVGLMFARKTRANLSSVSKSAFLGYSSQHKGYKCLHIPTNRMFISRDAVFDENVFPFSHAPPVSEHTPPASSHVLIEQFADVAHAPLLLPNHGA
jgi:hypothetical protein